jgi:hypothetical protein
MNAANDQYLAVFFNLSFCLRNQPPFTGRNFTRFQRAAKSAGQSARRRGDNIIQSCRMRLMDLRVNAVMLGNFRMRTKLYRLILLGQIGTPQRALNALNFYSGCVNNVITHSTSPSKLFIFRLSTD